MLLIVIIRTAHILLINRKKPEAKEKKPPTWIQTTRYNRSLYEALFKLREKFRVDHICIARLHNGGLFNNTLPVRRFSVIMEAHNPNRTKSLIDVYRDTHISKFPEVMHQLIFMKDFICNDIDYCEDNKFKDDVSKLGYKSSFLFLIRQVDEDRTPEAFIWLNFSYHREFTKEEQTEVWAAHNKILNLLNMTKEI